MSRNRKLTNDLGRVSSIPTDIRATNYSEENIIYETDGYSALINAEIADHPWVQHLMPLELGGFDLVGKVKDGLLIAALLDKIEKFKSVVNWSKLNLVKKKNADGTWASLNVFKMSENHRIVLNSANKMGVKIVNIGESDLIEGRVPLVLGLTKQILTFKRMVEFADLMENKKVSIRRKSAVQAESANAMMMGFVNSVLDSAGKPELHITNFTSCLKDSVVYLYLLNEISPNECSLDALQKEDMLDRANEVIANARNIGAFSHIRPQDIVHGNMFMNFDLIVAIACTDAAVEKLKSKEVNFGRSSGDAAGEEEKKDGFDESSLPSPSLVDPFPSPPVSPVKPIPEMNLEPSFVTPAKQEPLVIAPEPPVEPVIVAPEPQAEPVIEPAEPAHVVVVEPVILHPEPAPVVVPEPHVGLFIAPAEPEPVVFAPEPQVEQILAPAEPEPVVVALEPHVELVFAPAEPEPVVVAPEPQVELVLAPAEPEPVVVAPEPQVELAIVPAEPEPVVNIVEPLLVAPEPVDVAAEPQVEQAVALVEPEPFVPVEPLVVLQPEPFGVPEPVEAEPVVAPQPAVPVFPPPDFAPVEHVDEQPAIPFFPPPDFEVPSSQPEEPVAVPSFPAPDFEEPKPIEEVKEPMITASSYDRDFEIVDAVVDIDSHGVTSAVEIDIVPDRPVKGEMTHSMLAERETFDMRSIEVSPHTEKSQNSHYNKFNDDDDAILQIEENKQKKLTPKHNNCCRDHCLEILLAIAFATGVMVLLYFLWKKRNG